MKVEALEVLIIKVNKVDICYEFVAGVHIYRIYLDLDLL